MNVPPAMPATQPGLNQAAQLSPPAVALDRNDATGTSPAVRMVNCKRINLNFEVKDVGPSGVSTIELWYTRDCRTWKKHDAAPQTQGPCVVEVPEEGLYGFTMIAHSGIGLSKAPPQAGDLPQVWVEVDLTKPIVRVLDAEIGSGGKPQNLLVRWSATDKNMSPRAVSLSYAEQPEGPWTPIAANIENSGRHLWEMPLSVPRRLFLKVEASDLVGNVGSAVSATPVVIDLSQPTVSILAVEPNTK